MKYLEGKRTHIIAASGVIAAALAFAAGDMTLAEAIQAALVSASISTLRIGVAKK